MSSVGDIASGTYGDIAWVIDGSGKLTVMGTGDFTDAVDTCRAPWNNYTRDIISAKVNVTDMTDVSYMFYNCWSLKDINLSGFDTSSVTNMRGMFWYCGRLAGLDVGKFNTSKVTNMSAMFLGCGALKTLDISSFNTANVTDMSEMFAVCGNLINLDVSNFDARNVKYMGKEGWYIMLGLDSDGSNENGIIDESADIVLEYDRLIDREGFQHIGCCWNPLFSFWSV